MTKHGNRAREETAENGATKFHFRSPVITTCLVVIALCIGGYAFSYLKAVLSPLLIALFIFFLTNPIVRFFRARNYSPSFAYFIVLLMTVVTFFGFGFAIFGNIQSINKSLVKYQGNIERVVNDLSSPIMQTLDYLGLAPKKKTNDAAINPAKPESRPTQAEPPPDDDSQSDGDPSEKLGEQSLPPQMGQQSPQEQLRDVLNDLFRQVSREGVNQVIGTSLEYLEISVMTIFYLLFILVEAHKLPQRIKRGFAYESTQTLMEMGSSIQRSIEQYLRVKTGVSFGLGMTTGLIGMIFGLDFWLLWAGFMFLSNYVTYIGSMVALVPPIAIAFLQFQSTPLAIVLAVLLIANRFFWIDYVEIRLSGQQLNVSPVILLLSIGLFGALWGVIGMVLAVPVITSVKIALAQFDSTSHLASLLSED